MKSRCSIQLRRSADRGFILLEGLIALLLLLFALLTLHGFWMRVLHKDWRQEVVGTQVLVDFVLARPPAGTDSVAMDERAWRRTTWIEPDGLGNQRQQFLIISEAGDSLHWQGIATWGPNAH